MNSQNILITGISGQDGLFLTNYLLSNKLSNFKVFGVSRQNSEATLRNLKTLNKAQTSYIDFATRNVSGSETVMDLTNVGSATLSGDLSAS